MLSVDVDLQRVLQSGASLMQAIVYIAEEEGNTGERTTRSLQADSHGGAELDTHHSFPGQPYAGREGSNNTLPEAL